MVKHPWISDINRPPNYWLYRLFRHLIFSLLSSCSGAISCKDICFGEPGNRSKKLSLSGSSAPSVYRYIFCKTFDVMVMVLVAGSKSFSNQAGCSVQILWRSKRCSMFPLLLNRFLSIQYIKRKRRDCSPLKYYLVLMAEYNMAVSAGALNGRVFSSISFPSVCENR